MGKNLFSSLMDGLVNTIANLGTHLDKRTSGEFQTNILSAPQLDSLYESDWITQNAVDIPAEDAIREGRYFENLDNQEEYIKLLNTLGIDNKIKECLKWAQLYGGSVLHIQVPGDNLEKPLETDSLKGKKINFIVLDRWDIEALADTFDTNIHSKTYGRPLMWQLIRDGIRKESVLIHVTRFIFFDGVKLSKRGFEANNYWHGSIVQKLYSASLNLHTAMDSSASMIFETNVDVISIKNLVASLSINGETYKSQMLERFRLASLMKSNHNMIMLDAEEEYTKKKNSFSGLPDLADRFLLVASAAAQIPATRFLGQAPKGLNATGEGDLINYYDRVRSSQISSIKPIYEIVDSYIKLAYFPNKELDTSFKFNPLWQQTETETLTNGKVYAETVKILMETGIVGPAEVTTILKTIKKELYI